MKVLFAVSHENISESIVKKYQKEYKEIITYKNVYYFNAILKELQRDKSYDRIVISEDLQPFVNNNYDAIDKFIFETLDNISDEATNSGDSTPIILICTQRRSKSESLLVKLFGIGIYNALLGNDRSTDEVCKLLNRPRNKKEAKIYYKIESDDVSYEATNEDDVSEIEIQNILTHYKRISKSPERFVESFNNIAAQYSDAQLRVIIKFLPLNVKTVLEAESTKYQSVMTFGDPSYKKPETRKKFKNENRQEEKPLEVGFIGNQAGRPKLSKPVIVPSAVNTDKVKKLSRITNQDKQTQENEKVTENKVIEEQMTDIMKPEAINETNTKEETETVEKPKRGRGRPKKILTPEEEALKAQKPKRGRGRPKKVVKEENEEVNLFSLAQEEQKEEEATLPGLEEEQTQEPVILPGFEKEKQEEEITLPGFEEAEQIEEEEAILPGFEEDNIIEENKNATLQNLDEFEDFGGAKNYQDISTAYNSNHNQVQNDNLDNLLTKDKKIVSFVGTSKNGTSFLVNNLASMFSNMNIKTAILDLTTNKNSYYIYTKNEDNLRNQVESSIKQLENGVANGILVNKNLSVYTSIPGEDINIENANGILSTLIQNYSLVLIDCDFSTPIQYFNNSQEIYLVQSMDILTIQPLTAFLRDLKAKNVLNQEKLRIIINKDQKVRSLNAKVLIGGMAFYNDPSMSFMTELFNKDNIKYCTIPFEQQTYIRYLEGLVNCEISLNGYSKSFMTSLKALGNMVYPLLNNKYKPLNNYYGKKNKFSSGKNSY